MEIDARDSEVSQPDGSQIKGRTTPLLLRIAEAADYLAISRSKTYALIASGTLPHVRVGSSLRVPGPALYHWIEQRTEGGTKVGE